VAIFDTIHHNPVKNGILCLPDEDGKEGMEGSTEKKGAPGSLVDLKRDLYPSEPCADLKKNQKHVQDTEN
jgi:hypothetical protein